MSYNKESEDITEEIGYFSIGGTIVPQPYFRKLYTYEGIKNIFEKMNEGDIAEVCDWRDYSNECENHKAYTKVSIIRKQKYIIATLIPGLDDNEMKIRKFSNKEDAIEEFNRLLKLCNTNPNIDLKEENVIEGEGKPMENYNSLGGKVNCSLSHYINSGEKTKINAYLSISEEMFGKSDLSK